MSPVDNALYYRYCGLGIRSQLALSGLPAVASGQPADIEIRVVSVPRCLPDALKLSPILGFSRARREVLWQFEPIGYFYIRDGGCVIEVEPAPGISNSAISAFLLQPVFTLALLLQGEFLLSASAVTDGDTAIAFAGGPASGKSVAAAAMQLHRHLLVSDSLLRVTVTAAGELLAHPQAPWQQLWPDAIERLEISGEQRAIRQNLAVRNVAVPLVGAALPLTHLFLLQTQGGSASSGGFGVSAINSGVEKLKDIRGNTAASAWLELIAGEAAVPARWLLAMVARSKVFRLEIPWDWSTINADFSHNLAGSVKAKLAN